MEGEISNFIMVWSLVIISTCYCYKIARIIPPGKSKARLAAILPVVCLFLYLPLNLNSIHLGLTTAFYIAWLANFKLLLFCFGRGPISDQDIPLPHFVVFACLPINAKPSQQNKPRKYSWYYRKQAVFLAFLVFLHANKHSINTKVMQFVYCVYIYIGLEAILGLAGRLAKNRLGLDLEPPFDDPYLSSSLEDFWGRRWNKTGSTILRAAVYDPVHHYFIRVLGRKWARVPAVMSTFLVSGLMHELLMLYVGRVRPGWRFTGFFLIQGTCLVVEGVFRRKFPAIQRVPRVVTGPVIFGFVIVMYIWLVRPQLEVLKTDSRGVQEYAAVAQFLMSLFRPFIKLVTA